MKTSIDRLIGILHETDALFFDDSLRADARKKGDCDYVTRADLTISEYLHRRLGEEFPEIAFLSEEEALGNAPEAARDCWILDPIDGTCNFMRGIGLCGISLALQSDGEIRLGIIYLPHTRELFAAECGHGATLNGRAISVSERTSLADSLALFEHNAYFKEEHTDAADASDRIFRSCLDIRTLGSSALSLAYVACGRADAFLGRYLKPWDYAAGALILREAGGELAEVDTERPERHIVAACGGVFNDFCKILNLNPKGRAKNEK